MKNSTARRLVALGLGAALILSGCSSSDSDDAPQSKPSDGSVPSPTFAPATPEDIAALDAVTVTGEPGEELKVDFEAPFEVSTPVGRVISEGAGDAAIADGVVWLRSVTFDGSTGDPVPSSWDTPAPLDLNDAPEGHPLAELFRDQKVGAQLLYANPLQQSEDSWVTALSAFEVIAPLPALTPDEGMPTATFDKSGKPSLTVEPGYAGPSELITEVLTEGTGPIVEEGQAATFNYTGWLQSNGEQFDSSWDRGEPFETPIGTGKVIPGWDQAIVGKPIGSTLLLVIPPDLAYGASGQGAIPGGATLVFVVEILDAE